MKLLSYSIVLCFIITVIACNNMNKKDLVGRWTVELENCHDTVFVMNNDTIVTPEFRFQNDSIYMDVWQNGILTRSENMGIYYIRDEQFVFVDRLGNKKITKFEISNDILLFKDIDDPSKILMRLTRMRKHL